MWRNEQMANRNDNKTTYTKDMLIKMVSADCKRDRRIVREVYESIERHISELLSSADQDNDISIRLFEGIVFDGVYVPEHEKVNNLTGETIVAKAKISPKARITRSYCDKINAH